MESKQYRIINVLQKSGGYHLVVTLGLMDTRRLGWYAKQSEARTVAKAHAQLYGFNPIILT